MEYVNEARIGTQKPSRCGTASIFTVLLTVIWSFACNFGGTCSPICLSAIASNAIICKHTFHFHITCDDTDDTVITHGYIMTATMRLAVVFVSRTSWDSGFLHCGMEPRWWQRSCHMRPQLFNTRFLWLGPAILQIPKNVSNTLTILHDPACHLILRSLYYYDLLIFGKQNHLYSTNMKLEMQLVLAILPGAGTSAGRSTTPAGRWSFEVRLGMELYGYLIENSLRYVKLKWLSDVIDHRRNENAKLN